MLFMVKHFRLVMMMMMMVFSWFDLILFSDELLLENLYDDFVPDRENEDFEFEHKNSLFFPTVVDRFILKQKTKIILFKN